MCMQCLSCKNVLFNWVPFTKRASLSLRAAQGLFPWCLLAADDIKRSLAGIRVETCTSVSESARDGGLTGAVVTHTQTQPLELISQGLAGAKLQSATIQA